MVAEVKLTQKERRALDELLRYYMAHGALPSRRELGRRLGVTSSSTAQAYITSLEAKGYLVRRSPRPGERPVLYLAETIELAKLDEPSGLTPSRATIEQVTAALDTLPPAPARRRRFTAQKREILLAVVRLRQHLGYNPSIKEIGAEVGLSSTSTTWEHVRDLVKWEYLVHQPNAPRSIRLSPKFLAQIVSS